MLTNSSQISVQDEIVINWHITEACNFACRYCYAKWEKPDASRELIHDLPRSTQLMSELRTFFATANLTNPLSQKIQWRSIRLNFAGGEPLLYDQQVLRTIKVARDLGFSVSMITNASRLNTGLIRELAPQLSLLGVSVDSTNAARNRKIGRCDKQGQVLSVNTLAKNIRTGREINPDLRIKINTVVNALNFDEDMTDLIRELNPEKWKVLRMLPTVTNDLNISDAQFSAFIDRHASLPLSIEDNVDMTKSYIMIDPQGRFFQNDADTRGYRYSHPIIDVGAEQAFSQVSLSTDRYLARYRSIAVAK